jgi:N-acetylglucosamine malate deacetylase 2
MKKLLFAIFAHPDDEAFGPSGTLVLETRSGTELHLITLTCGQAGQNPDNHENLGEVRLVEWHAAAKLMGATSTHHLNYRDGQLCNNTLVEIQSRLVKIVRHIYEQQEEDCQVEFMTMDDNGITGHIDHTVASRAASYAFYSLKTDGLPLTRIRYICAPQTVFATPNTDWIFMPAGRTPEEIDETIDAREVLDTVRDIMRCHYTQREDAEAHLNARGDGVAINHFIVRS